MVAVEQCSALLLLLERITKVFNIWPKNKRSQIMESLNNVKQKHCEFARAARCFAVSFHFVVYWIVVGMCVYATGAYTTYLTIRRECAHHRNIDETSEYSSSSYRAPRPYTARDDD